jgi:AcrR family transcriptional regulator
MAANPPGDPKRRRSQAERSAAARSLLIEIAIHQICERGLAYVTMAEIAVAAGMTRGAIQHHFGTRDDYMRAVLAALTDRVVSRLTQQPPANKGNPDSPVRRCVEALGRIVLSREQLAVTDISISSRAVPMLLADSRMTSLRMTEAYGAAWRRWLDDTYPKAAIAKGFDIFRFFCSGVLVNSYGSLDSHDHRDELALCAELVETAMTA